MNEGFINPNENPSRITAPESGTTLGSFANKLPVDVQLSLGVPSAFPYLYLTIGIAVAAIIIAVIAIVMKRR